MQVVLVKFLLDKQLKQEQKESLLLSHQQNVREIGHTGTEYCSKERAATGGSSKLGYCSWLSSGKAQRSLRARGGCRQCHHGRMVRKGKFTGEGYCSKEGAESRLQVLVPTKQQQTRLNSFHQLIWIFRKLNGQTVFAWWFGAACRVVWTSLTWVMWL